MTGAAWQRLCGTAAGAFLTFALCVPAFAESVGVPCIMTGEDVGNGYEYTAPGIGSFTVNGAEGETFQAAVFSLDEGLEAELYQDGEAADFGSGMVLDPGDYELRIYAGESRDGNYGVFRFSVQNDYADTLTASATEVRVEEDPPLTLSYEADTGRFRYTLPDGKWFECNVPLGGWSRGQAELTTSDGLNLYTVRRDGETVEAPDGYVFRETGSYEISARDNELGTAGSVSYRVLICFGLYLDKQTNRSLVTAPLGMTIDSISCDGKLLRASGQHAWLTKDGGYLVTFADSAGRRCWQMEFTRDTVPPKLRFDRPADGQQLKKEISFQAPEPLTQVRIFRNGEEVQASLGKIAVNGDYRMEATDEAGNMREYEFTLDARYGVPPVAWFLVPVLGAAAAAVAFFYWRGHMDVI